MMKFELFVDVFSERFISRAEAGGNLSVECYICLEGCSFPTVNHFDFPVIILSWWLENILALKETLQPCVNSFMDGPYSFTTAPAGDAIENRLP